MTISDNHKFACVAVTAVACEELDIDLGNGYYAQSAPPYKLDDFWSESLGGFILQALDEAKLFIGRSLPSLLPHVLDAENTALEHDSMNFLSGLAMLGVKQLRRPLLMSGARESGSDPLLRRMSNCEKAFRWSSDMISPAPVSEKLVRAALDLGLSLASIFSDAAHYHRLKRGLGSLLRALRDREPQHRLHQLIRSLDAIAMTEQGKGRKQFVHRLQAITGRDAVMEQMLDELYRMRSAVEHLRSFEGIALAVSDDEFKHYFEKQLVAAEIIALETYTRLLSSNALLLQFKDEDRIRLLWARRNVDQEWATVSVEAILRKRRADFERAVLG